MPADHENRCLSDKDKSPNISEEYATTPANKGFALLAHNLKKLLSRLAGYRSKKDKRFKEHSRLKPTIIDELLKSWGKGLDGPLTPQEFIDILQFKERMGLSIFERFKVKVLDKLTRSWTKNPEVTFTNLQLLEQFKESMNLSPVEHANAQAIDELVLSWGKDPKSLWEFKPLTAQQSAQLKQLQERLGMPTKYPQITTDQPWGCPPDHKEIGVWRDGKMVSTKANPYYYNSRADALAGLRLLPLGQPIKDFGVLVEAKNAMGMLSKAELSRVVKVEKGANPASRQKQQKAADTNEKSSET